MEIGMVNGTNRVSEVAAPDPVKTVSQAAPKPEPVEGNSFVRTDASSGQKDVEQKEQLGKVFEEKDPTMNSIDSAFSSANSKLAKTRCEYSYDENTKRVSIKVYDKDSDELIREVPPEKSLEMLQRIWELAGIMVDEKR